MKTYEIVVCRRPVPPQIYDRNLLQNVRLNPQILESLESSRNRDIIDIPPHDLVGGDSRPPDEIPQPRGEGEDGTGEVRTLELLERQGFDEGQEGLEGVGLGTREGERRADGRGSGHHDRQSLGDVEDLRAGTSQ